MYFLPVLHQHEVLLCWYDLISGKDIRRELYHKIAPTLPTVYTQLVRHVIKMFRPNFEVPHSPLLE